MRCDSLALKLHPVFPSCLSDEEAEVEAEVAVETELSEPVRVWWALLLNSLLKEGMGQSRLCCAGLAAPRHGVELQGGAGRMVGA
jgi:hypothetical protein